MFKITFYLTLYALIFFTLQVSYSDAFSSDAEIDAYFDAQQRQLQIDYDTESKAIEDRLDAKLKSIADKKLADTWEVYRRVYGENFEMVKIFLPESNPNPAEHAHYIGMLTHEQALRAIRNIDAVNSDLAAEVKILYEKARAEKMKRGEPDISEVSSPSPAESAEIRTETPASVVPSKIVNDSKLVQPKPLVLEKEEPVEEDSIEGATTELIDEVQPEEYEEKPKRQRATLFSALGAMLKRLMFWK